ncbi:MAG TPA: sugar phosphate nucleotidyltransferase [Anaerolineales bacterium]|nr:sugar phosphate nucleotidyltransferase [Anaerolineales bacterium]
MSEQDDDRIGLIPAAGRGIRLGLPYPKELYPIIRDNRYKPVSQFVLENLVAAGVGHIVFVINDRKSQLIGYFGDGSRFGCRLSYVVQEPAPEGESTSPGLANALDSAYHLTKGKTVLFGMADTIMQPADVFTRALASLSPGDAGVLCLFPTGSPHKFGMVRLDGARVVEIVDKPRGTDLTHMWGCIVWQPEFTEHLHRCQEERVGDFADILNRAVRGGQIFRGLALDEGEYLDLGTYEEIMELDKRLRD